jgi:hypothetical protein
MTESWEGKTGCAARRASPRSTRGGRGYGRWEENALVSWKGSIFWEEIRQEQYDLVKSGERKK